MDTPENGSVTTLKFQRAIITTLQQASPQLAALHAIRHRKLAAGSQVAASNNQMALSPLHCTRCGTLGVVNRSVSLRRKSKGKKHNLKQPTKEDAVVQKVFRTTCGVCGVIGDRPYTPDTARCFPKFSKSSTPLQKSSILEKPTIPIVAEPSTRKATPAPPTLPTKTVSVQTPSASYPGSKSASPAVQEGPSLAQQKRPKKKKTGLQEMLAKHQEQQRMLQERQSNSGLAAFLGGL